MFDRYEAHHYDGPELPAELSEIEQRLGRMKLALPRVDRDQLMFAAGSAAASQDGPAMHIARPSWSEHQFALGRSWLASRFWPAATATMTAATVLLATMLIRQSPPAKESPELVATQVTVNPQPALAVAQPDLETTNPWSARWSSWPWAGPPSSGYLATRHAALMHGLAALDREAFAEETGGRPVDTRERPATARELLQELLPEPISPLGARS
jgi:hypothetical protein